MNAVTVRLLFPSGCSGELELQFDSVTCKYNRGFVSGGGMKTKNGLETYCVSRGAGADFTSFPTDSAFDTFDH